MDGFWEKPVFILGFLEKGMDFKNHKNFINVFVLI